MLRYILLLCDKEKVFRAALGLYDLDLAAKVGARAQKDPHEYVPWFEKLRELPVHMQRFQIDDYLGSQF